MHCSGACQGLLWRCSGLRVLHITGAERLQEDALGMLAPLAATLRELSLRGCSLLRDRAGHHLQALTQLTSLDIGGEEICQHHARQCISARHDVNAILYKSRELHMLHGMRCMAAACETETAMALQGQRYHQEASWICAASLCCLYGRA